MFRRHYLWHLTSAANLDSILARGVDPGHWGSEAAMRYYERIKLRDDPLILCVPLRRFAADKLEPDLRGRLDPPDALALGMSEDEVERLWFASPQTWRDGLRLMGTVYYRDAVRVTRANVTR